MNTMNETSDPEWAEQVRRRRKRRWLLGGGLLLVVALVAGGIIRFKLAEQHAQKEVDAIIAELDAADPYWRLPDIESRRRAMPDDENAAYVVMQAAALLPKPFPSRPPPAADAADADEYVPDLQDQLADAPFEEVLDPVLAVKLREELTAAAPALTKARTLAGLRYGRYPVTYTKDFIGTRLPDIQGARDLATLLQFDVMARCRDNDIEGALRSCRAQLIAARSMGDEPLLMSQLVRIACVGVGLRCLERTLAQGQASEKTLSELQRLLEEEEAEPIVLNAARGERGGDHMLMQGLEDGTVSLSQLPESLGSKPSQSRILWQRLAPGLAARQAHAVILRKTTEAIQILKLPLEEQLDSLHEYEQGIKAAAADMPTLARLLLPIVPKLAEASIRERAVLRSAIAALAAERFRLGNERWPKDLAELVPAYLKQVPTDPYDGKPLRFRVVAEGLKIYSVGLDRQDDGGKMDRERPFGPGTDLVFRLWNFEDRRQPAANPDIGPPRPTRRELDRMERQWMQQGWMNPPPEQPKAP